MSIDPLTFIAQVVNFAILVWLLKKVLYGPVLAAIQEREDRFLKRQAQLDELEQACEQLKGTLEAEKSAFEEEAQERHRQVLAEAQVVKQKELDKARRDVENLSKRWKDGLSEQREQFLAEIRKKTARSVIEIAGRVLSDLTDEEHLNNLAVERFLESCDELELEGLVVVRSAAELDGEQQKRLQERFGEVRFEVEPELVLGLELVHEGRRIGWSARAHLEAMQAELDSLLREGAAA